MAKCLIVDDVAVSRFTASQFIQELGLEVVSAENGDQAISVAKDNHVDVVLLDWHLGGGTLGVDVIKSLRDVIGETTPIVVFSGVEKQENANAALNEGANDFLEKPTTKEKLRTCLKSLGIKTTG